MKTKRELMIEKMRGQSIKIATITTDQTTGLLLNEESVEVSGDNLEETRKLLDLAFAKVRELRRLSNK